MQIEKTIESIYTEDELVSQRKRYRALIKKAGEQFGQEPCLILSVPGRTELSGNHTDHNLGRVLAAGIHLDKIAAVIPNNDNSVQLISEAYENPCLIRLNDLKCRESEKHTTNALIRGIAARLHELGYKVGGFRAMVTSRVLTGSGLSSSAAIEILIASIFNHLYNKGRIDNIELARAAQYAENEYFGKPCGLMDQLVCSYGGILAIDFKQPEKPQIIPVQFDFASHGYNLFIIDTGGSHADLTRDYASIPVEMKKVARALGKEYCVDLSRDQVLANLSALRKQVNDRAILRCLHFLVENERVEQQAKALANNDMPRYLKLVNDSGNSSWKLLQNCYSLSDPEMQSIPLALTLSELFLKGQGACRVHGGGFAGTIQVYVPINMSEDYIKYMDRVWSKQSITRLRIRQQGVFVYKNI